MADWTDEHVVAAVHHYFPDEDFATILSLLDEYGVESYEYERERLQVAILRLSRGDTDALLADISAAKRDYRDVLWWSDTPVEPPIAQEEVWGRPIPPPEAFILPAGDTDRGNIQGQL